MPSSTQVSLPTPPGGPTQLQFALDAFRTTLNDNQRQEFDASSAQPDAIDVINFTTVLDQKNAARRSRCIAVRVHTILESVQMFSAIVDTFVSSNPKVAALVWGSVKLALLIASDCSSYFEKLSNLFMTFGRHCPRYSEYQTLYLDSARLQTSLCNFYATLIHCCTKAVQVIQRPGWTQLFKAALSSFESDFSLFEQELRRWSKEVKDETLLASQKAAQQERHLQVEERKEAKTHRLRELLFQKNVTKDIGGRRDRDQQIEKCRSIERKRALLDKLSNFDYNRPFKRARKQCIGGTAQWLIQSSEFEEWVAEIPSSMLWCSGKLGSGKTVLMASTIAHLSQQYGRVAYFFCQFDNEASLKASTILSSLLKQVLDPVTLSTELESRLSQLLHHGHPDSEDLEEILQEAITKSGTYFFMIDGIDECIEAERETLLAILQQLCSITNRRVKLLLSSRDGNDRHVRKTCQIVHSVTINSSKSRLDLETIVEARLSEAVDREQLTIGDPNILREIKCALTKGADGMLLWVDLQLQEIFRQASDYEIRSVLQNLPKDLYETYDRLLGRVVESGKEEKVKRIFDWITCGKRLLSLEELSEAIVIEPCQTNFMPDRLVNDIAKIPGWCFGLATCDEEDGAVQFAHSTVQSFLIGTFENPKWPNFHLNIEDADTRLGEICVTYLNFSDFEMQLVKKRKPQRPIVPQDIITQSVRNVSSNRAVSRTVSKVAQIAGRHSQTAQVTTPFPWSAQTQPLESFQATHPFLNYASEFWIYHCANLNKDKVQVWRLWKSLLSIERGTVNAPWTQQEFAKRGPAVIEFIQDHQHLALLQLVEDSECRLNEATAKELVKSCAERGSTRLANKLVELCQLTTEMLSAKLQSAAELGHIEILERLLAAGADVNAAAAEYRGRTALQAAAEGGHIEIVERLLAVGADVNAAAADYYGRTALQAAAEGGHIKTVERLLAVGADINAAAVDYTGRTALQAAAEGGHIKTVERLLAAGADVNAAAAVDYTGRTALQAAAEGGHIKTVERLLAAGADVNAAGYDGRTALKAAAGGGHIEIVERLLAAGADVNAAAAVDYTGRTALQAAAEGGHIKTVERLLAAGADVNAAAGYDGRTALKAAAGGGHIEIVERLLAAGADVNAAAAVDYTGRTALQAAAEGGHIKTVERLLAAGADVNAAAGYDGRTALKAAAEGGHIKTVERLLAAGADVNAAGYDGRTALKAAAEGGHIKTVERLLAAGADVNAAGYDGRTALKAAAGGGHIEIVERLLAAGADVNAAGYDGRTALKAAAGGGHIEIVERLLAVGADVNAAAGYDGKTALQLADQNGHSEIAQLLRKGRVRRLRFK